MDARKTALHNQPTHGEFPKSARDDKASPFLDEETRSGFVAHALMRAAFTLV
jgi:hypothetical protein